MPEIKLQHVVSVTGEDKNYPADNLLKSESFKKWKSASVGEKQVSVTLQVILVASSFMNPMESRNGQNLNRVRIFGTEKLSKVTLDPKWDRVKVVCTQPFNKTTQYGLAFIKFHSPPTEADKEAEAAEAGKKTFGAFSVRTSSDDSIQQGSLFARRGKDPVQTTPLTGAAAVRAASKLAEESRTERGSSHPSGVVSQRGDHAAGIVSKHADSERNSSKQPVKRSHSHGDERRGNADEKQSAQRQSHASGPCATGRSTYDTPPPSKKARSETPVVKKKKQPKVVPLDEVMGRVVFVLSGFQNPQRGQLRDKARLRWAPDTRASGTDNTNGRPSPVESVDSGDVTEDEMPSLKKADGEGKGDDSDPYAVSTDEENESSSGGELPELPDFFTGKHFFFYGALTPTERRTLLRYITAYNGQRLVPFQKYMVMPR
ncbi:hypothetical protein NP493_6g03019 [Ridgeia piscesae]|uniref:DNA-repair protein Xrcc1 N-terminal domain-containing protein n=1 Tax=Ridgeia piscesae TaxID=27915 RepID=A0AAD9PG26_RIDPI|nr:hypothetical protein NP493_6g03019 [Ridgeia piscesae]